MYTIKNKFQHTKYDALAFARATLLVSRKAFGLDNQLWKSGADTMTIIMSKCRTIERGMAEYDGCIIEPRGRVYIGIQGAS
jgi:hypothetical protein